jgi:hypothetical protein
MRIVATAVAYLISFALVAVAAFFTVFVLAGPHSGFLPGWLGVVLFGLGWLVVLLLPVLMAYKVWRRLGSQPPGGSFKPKSLRDPV